MQLLIFMICFIVTLKNFLLKMNNPKDFDHIINYSYSTSILQNQTVIATNIEYHYQLFSRILIGLWIYNIIYNYNVNYSYRTFILQNSESNSDFGKYRIYCGHCQLILILILIIISVISTRIIIDSTRQFCCDLFNFNQYFN